MDNLTLYDDGDFGQLVGLDGGTIVVPKLRVWEVNEHTTFFERLVAAPSDETIMQFWIAWSAVCIMSGIISASVLIPLLFTKSVRQNPFNNYLIFLMIPDTLTNWSCFGMSFSSAIMGHFNSERLCKFQSVYVMGCAAANTWLNAVVSYQLYKMMSSAKRFRRYTPPTTWRVRKEAFAVYVFALFLGCWGILGQFIPLMPRVSLIIGACCLPAPYDVGSAVIFYAIYLNLVVMVPFTYVVGVCSIVWYKQMLPPRGRSRGLVIYFLRLIAVFVILWLPSIVLVYMSGAAVDPWITWTGAALVKLQPSVSAIFSLLKPDIWEAVHDFWPCFIISFLQTVRRSLMNFTENHDDEKDEIVEKTPPARDTEEAMQQAEDGTNVLNRTNSDPNTMVQSAHSPNRDAMRVANHHRDPFYYDDYDDYDGTSRTFVLSGSSFFYDSGVTRSQVVSSNFMTGTDLSEVVPKPQAQELEEDVAPNNHTTSETVEDPKTDTEINGTIADADTACETSAGQVFSDACSVAGVEDTVTDSQEECTTADEEPAMLHAESCM